MNVMPKLKTKTVNIGFCINHIETEKPGYATTELAMAALKRGHTMWYVQVEDFAYDPDEQVRARACAPPKTAYRSNKAFLAGLQGEDARCERIAMADLDVLLLRNNPSDDASERPWAQSAGIIFGQIAARQGVMVLNDPFSLANALNKLYFQTFPREVRPETLITRDPREIRAFVDEHKGKAVLKPLQGSGGQNVFLVQEGNLANLNQIIEAISRDGYVVAQEFLPAAAAGDLRLFLMNGEPLVVDGKYAAFRRVNPSEDVRSNMHAGGEARPAKIDETVLHVAEVVRPKLIQDGMFLVGLDIVGDKLMEVNVFSPGGLHSMQALQEAPFAEAVIEAIEDKVEHVHRYGRVFDNLQLATM